MRILVVSFVFPPFNIIGAVRVGKTAKYLWRSGHDVRVVAAADLDLDPSLDLEVPAENVVYTRWTDVDRPYRLLLRARKWIASKRPANGTTASYAANPNTVSGETFSSIGPLSEKRRLAWRLRLLYTNLVHLPDYAIGWRRHAVRAGVDLAKQWRPDVILASGAPWTSFVVARELSERLRVPWVAEFRDLWSANHTTFVSDWRKRYVDAWYESRVLKSAAALVTVSEPLADRLRARFPDKPIDVVLNGFDDEDYRETSTPDRNGAIAAAPAARRPSADPNVGPVLRLLYTGEINRDLCPLLEAIRLLNEDARCVRLDIVGLQSPAVRERYRAIAVTLGIADQCVWHSPVSHAEASRLQQRADVLVLLLHESPNDAGVFTGKLFEYVGARRPILVAGAVSGVAADLVRQRQLGHAEAAPERIARRLRAWLAEKRERGSIAPPESAAVDDLSRKAQTRALADVLERVTSP